MDVPIRESEASFALRSIEQQREQVAAEIGMPSWYWGFLAVGWVGLGLLADLAPSWASTMGTIAFGALHASISPMVLTGRRGSSQVSLRSDVVSRVPLFIIGFLVAMSAVTVGFALGLHADGTRHPAIWASVAVAVMVLLGGPTFMAAFRRHFSHSSR